MNWILKFRFVIASLFGALIMLSTLPASAQDVDTRAKQVWQLLDYIAVDYGGAVEKGAVIEPSEYSEMQDFAANAEKQLQELPKKAGSERLIDDARALRELVNGKAEATAVADHAHRLAGEVLKIYPFPVAPAKAPDLRLGARLFQAQCASCHGISGHGDGPAAAQLNPKPTALADHARARERSLFAIHQIIGNGVQGTAMPSFASLTEDDRWALAFFVGTLPYTDEQKTAGEVVWKKSSEARTTLAGLDALTQLSESDLSAKLKGDASALTAFVRNSPQSVAANASGGQSAALAKARLRESVAAFEQGDRFAATKLALSAYLDGFELLEPALAAKNRALFQQVEKAMIGYRATIASGSGEDVRRAEAELQSLLDETDVVLAPSEHDAAAAFFGALTILLREGLEALLVVVAMIAFLKKANRHEVLPYVHAGWAGALAAGGATWVVATYLIGISGASRELTEGFSSLFAAVILLGVGIWMHQKSTAGRWQEYLKQKMSAAMSRRSAWFMFLLAFVAVYREVFETVLFFAALWTESNGLALLAGLLCGAVVLGGVAFLLLRTSARLPIGKFFAASALLVAVLAVILAGKGVAGLQEAGWVEITVIPFPRVDILGMYPTTQTMLAQLAVLCIAVVGFFMNRRPVAAGDATKLH